MFLMRREQGRLEEIEALIRDAVDAYPGYRSFRCFVPLLELELGRGRRGAPRVRRAGRRRRSRRCRATPSGCSASALLAEVAAGLDDAGRRTVLYGLLAPYAGVNAMAAGEVMVGPVARYLGILAATSGGADDAAGHFEDALAIKARMAARPWLAHTQEDYARMLRERAGPGDDARARELLAACRATYRELGIVRSGG